MSLQVRRGGGGGEEARESAEAYVGLCVVGGNGQHCTGMYTEGVLGRGDGTARG
jgi:hypothetical protein